MAIKFNMAVEIAFERITQKPFHDADLRMQENLVALYYAVIVTNNKDTKIQLTDLIDKVDGKTISNLSTAVAIAMDEWMNIPVVESEEEEKQEDGEKN